ncbi:MAG: hypothetical protein ACK4KT_05405 [Thermaurantimonas sp.]
MPPDKAHPRFRQGSAYSALAVRSVLRPKPQARPSHCRHSRHAPYASREAFYIRPKKNW